MGRQSVRSLLVTGASLAGPALAYWADRFGIEVTLVERAAALRTGGYAIDIRGSAIDVVERMGCLDEVRAQHVATRQVTFFNRHGRAFGRVDPAAFGSGGGPRHVELPRGALTSLLFARVRERVETRFGDSIAALQNGPDGVEVAFQSGARKRFDLVVCCEGLHASTRALVFGPEQQFSRYLGYVFAIFEMPNTFGLRREVAIFNVPGKAAVLYSTNDGPTLYALLVHRRPAPALETIADAAAQRASLVEAFAGAGWLVPDILAAMQEAPEVYFDATQQIRMPAWSSGRVAVLGDAAYAPSFFTGQGTSLALVGAYMLAGALKVHDDPASALQAYEAAMRPYVSINQALVKEGSNDVAPGSAFALFARNSLVRCAPLLKRVGAIALATRGPMRAYEGIKLPAFERAEPPAEFPA